MKDREITVKPFFVRCVIIEAITVAAILIAVFIITLISPEHKQQIKSWYESHILEDTSAEEVLKGKDNYEI